MGISKAKMKVTGLLYVSLWSSWLVATLAFVVPSASVTRAVAGSKLTAIPPVTTIDSNVAVVPGSETTDREKYVDKLSLLDDALRFNSSVASDILAEMNRSTGASQDATEAFVSELMAALETPLPWWVQIRPLARFSKRARRASLQRVLQLATPAPDEKESRGDDVDAAHRRKRRSLFVLLRALASDGEEDDRKGDGTPGKIDRKARVPPIVQLEKAARSEAKSNANVEDIETRLPQGLETPAYDVLKRTKKTGYEIRRYQPFSVCSVSMSKPRPQEKSETDAKISSPQLAGASAFGALAGYLFGKNVESTAMKMTTPVISSGEGDARQMAFVLPSDFWKEGGLQLARTPLEGSGVTLIRDGGGEKAAIIFGGFAGKSDVETRTNQLLAELANDKEWKAGPDSKVTLAQYNDPFTPPWKRRNEVFIAVVPR